MTSDDKLVEAVARELAAQHYAERFRATLNAPIVQSNVAGNWQIWSAAARTAILATLQGIREPSAEMIATALPLSTIASERHYGIAHAAMALLPSAPECLQYDMVEAGADLVRDFETMIDTRIASLHPKGEAE